MKMTVGKDPGKVTAGEHEATITDIKEIDTAYGRALKFFFEITDMVNEEGDPPTINGLCSAKLSPSTKLYKWLSIMTPEGLGAEVDLDSFIGLSVKVLVTITEKNGIEYANVSEIVGVGDIPF